ncbi:MAG: lytic transglycosylase domain-containing protein [Bacteroidota bacterium]
MTKRKMRNTGLVSNGLLLIIAVVSVAATRQTANTGQRAVSDTTLQQLYFDTTFLTVSGVSETDSLTIPTISMNKQAKEYVKSFLVANSRILKEIREKRSGSLTVIDAVFAKYNLPLEMKYLAVVESELKLTALSRVGARGAWQLMPETARLFSLKVSAKYDERIHLYKSTVAVAKYLNYLYKMFGDWTLVIAAYNSGPGKVFEAIKKSGSRNFWKLQDFLPAETRGHVKKFIGTHYYFEGKGSATTLTKQETVAYRKVMTDFVAKQNALLKEKQDNENTDTLSENEEIIVRATHTADIKNNEK